jgi:uncharacterized protein (UPF0218 family)
MNEVLSSTEELSSELKQLIEAIVRALARQNLSAVVVQAEEDLAVARTRFEQMLQAQDVSGPEQRIN